MKSSGREYGLLECKHNDKHVELKKANKQAKTKNLRQLPFVCPKMMNCVQSEFLVWENLPSSCTQQMLSVGNKRKTHVCIVVTVSCRQPYLPSAVQIAWVVSRETRTEDDAAHVRKHPPTGSWQHRQQKSTIKVGLTTKTIIKVVVQALSVCVCACVCLFVNVTFNVISR